MGGCNRLPQTMNNDCFLMSLYNEYLPSDNLQAMRDVYQNLQIPTSAASIHGLDMTDRRVNGQGATPTQQPNDSIRTQQNVQSQQPNVFTLPGQTYLPQQGLPCPPQYRQHNAIPQAQPIRTQYQRNQNATQTIQNDQILYTVTANPARQTSPQAQRLAAQQLQDQQWQQVSPANGHSQYENMQQAMLQQPVNIIIGKPQTYAITYPQQVLRNGNQMYPPHTPLKRPAPDDENVPSPKRIRASQASPSSIVTSPQMSSHGHPHQYAQAHALQNQQRQQQSLQRQLHHQQIQQHQISPQMLQQQKRQQTPCRPHRSLSAQSNHFMEPSSPSSNNGNSQRGPGYAMVAQPIGHSPQRLQTPQTLSPAMQQPQTHALQSLGRLTAPRLNTVTARINRQKIMKAGFNKTPHQSRMRSKKQQVAISSREVNRVRHVSQQASPTRPSTPWPSSTMPQYHPQQAVQRPASVLQASPHDRGFVVCRDLVVKGVQQGNQVYGSGIPPVADQTGVKSQQSLPSTNNMPRTGSNTLCQNDAKQNMNLAQSRVAPDSQPDPKHFQPAAGGATPNSRVAERTLSPPVPFPVQHQAAATPSTLPILAERAIQPPRPPSPNEKEWATYLIDRVGSRYPKSKPPPQGSYHNPTLSEFGSEARDYSDPRDFYAPTAIERNGVWKALGPTRDDYFKLTGIKLNQGDLRCLDMGYHAAWDEIKRCTVSWAFDNYSSDSAPETKSGLNHGRTVERKLVADDELPGYSRYEVEVSGMKVTGDSGIEVARRVQEAKKFFEEGNLVFDPAKNLFKLERWYGLIDGYVYAPNWPGVRPKNRAGVLLQNPEAFACDNCRGSGRLCYGHKEHPDRKCKPCQLLGLVCSKEDVYVQRGPGRVERVPAKPVKDDAIPKGMRGRKILFAEQLRTKQQAIQRGRDPSPRVKTGSNTPITAIAPVAATATTAPVTAAETAPKPATPAQPPRGRENARFGRKKNWIK